MKETPVMSQYRRLKEEAGDAVLFFRMGDFYEMFMQDAIEAAPLLDLTLTTRDRNDPDPVPMAGVPWHSAEPYIARLLRAGRRVAICEQSAPHAGRGLMDREIVEILTPGTAVSEGLLAAGQNVFLAALAIERNVWGVALADISTGEFSVGEMPPVAALGEIERCEPRELLLPAGLDTGEALRTFLHAHPEMAQRELDRWLFSPSRGRELLREQYGVVSLEPFGLEALTAGLASAGALLAYAREQRRSPLAHLRPPRRIQLADTLAMDEATLRNLEVLEPRSGRGRHCLLGVLDATHTPMGARALRKALSRPFATVRAIETRLAAVAALSGAPDALTALREQLAGIGDLERWLSRIHCGHQRPHDLGRLRDGLQLVPPLLAVTHTLNRDGSFPIGTDVDPLEDLASEMDRALNATAELMRDGGTIRSGYDAELDRLRGVDREGRHALAALQEQERQATGIASLRVGYNQVFGYYLEVSHAHRARVPAHYHRKQTLVGAERYVIPELKEWEERLKAAEAQAQAREGELLEELARRIIAATAGIQALAAAVAEWDLVASFAVRAREHGYVRPHMTEGDRICIAEGRHPVVERLLDAEAFVPNDVDLDTQQRQIQIITGPNMAGKSTYLRQVGLLVIMAQAGSFVPAAKAEIGLVDRLFTRVGASDDIAHGQSTFLVEMIETSRILHGATSRSLVLLDEIGRGTSTFDGLAIAWAVAEHLRRDPLCRPRTLFATHFHELTALGRSERGYVNLNVLVKEWRDAVVFVRRVVEGSADRSYGIQVARLAGLPEALLSRAREILRALEDQAPRPLESAGPAQGVHQMPLFAQRGAIAPKSDHPGASAEPAAEVRVENETLAALRGALAGLDLSRITGLEALAWLDAWQHRLNGDPGQGSGREPGEQREVPS